MKRLYTNIPTKRKLKILFVIRAVEHYIYFRSIIESLNLRGHKVSVLFDEVCSSKKLNYLDEIKIKNVKLGWAPYSKSKWGKIIFYFRNLLSVRRYYKVSGQSDYYKKRWEKASLPFNLSLVLSISPVKQLILSDFFVYLITVFEKLMPVDEKIVKQLRDFKPDILLASPCNLPFVASCEVEYLKNAKRLNIPTILPVFSWDNLTTKGLIWIKPDYLFVWNRTQVQEAKREHGINPERIVITGSPFFDTWFSKLKPSLSREKFCKKLGLNPKQDIIVYLVSSEGIATEEIEEIYKIRKVLDNAKDKQIQNIQIIVRSHPNNNHRIEIKESNIVVFPNDSSLPSNNEAIQDFYDTIYYSFFVVGINTSAMLQAVILGKSIGGLIVKKWTKTQVESQHFQQLLQNDVLEVINSNQELIRSIKQILKGVDNHKKQRLGFVKNFIRPRGLNINAGDIAASEIERIVYRTH